MDDTLIATTAREIVFGAAGPDRVVRDFRRAPAGTEVYAHVRRNGAIRIRIPGTLFTQDVNAAAIIPA